VFRLPRPGNLLAALALAVAAGCGFGAPSVSPPDTAPTKDGPPADGPTDGPPDAPPAASCLPRWRDGTVTLGTPSLIAELASPQVDRDPYLMPDELTIFFSTYRNGTSNGDVFVATRPSLTAPFGTPVRRDDISSDNEDTRFSMSADELTAVVGSSRDGTVGNVDVWLATRMNKNAPFLGYFQVGVQNVNSPDNEHDPELSADGQRLYLAVGSPQRIAVSQRSSPGGAFGSVQPLTELFSNTGDADPSLSPDELVIVFSSRRRGGGDADLYYAIRTDKNAAFGTPIRVPTVNANNANDGDPTVSRDGCRLYFASDRSGNWDLYVASVMP
jgi:Tol biopolymer transport system component